MRWAGFSNVRNRLARRLVTPQLMGRAVRRQRDVGRFAPSRMVWVVPVGLLAALSLPGQVEAQDECTYSACALRVERGFFRNSLLQGATGKRIADVAFLAPQLDVFAERSDSAGHYYQAFRTPHNQSFWLGTIGGLLLGSAIVIEEVDRTQDELTWGIGIPGMALLITGLIRGLGSGNNLSKAVWWYNSTLPR
jgi:hypothetical protein